jgi:hypothetical protein
MNPAPQMVGAAENGMAATENRGKYLALWAVA